jgi:integrase
MRRSEILGLMEEDLDLEAVVPTLQIQRGLTVDPKGGVLIQKTKRKSSQRLLELSPRTVAALKQHRKRRAEEKLTALHWDEQGFVFTKLSGGYLHPNTLYSTYFKPLRDRAGVPPIHFHDLRHTYATLALLNGVPVKVVSEILGHRDVATTLRTYAHVLPGMQGQSARMMDSVLFGQG